MCNSLAEFRVKFVCLNLFGWRGARSSYKFLRERKLYNFGNLWFISNSRKVYMMKWLSSHGIPCSHDMLYHSSIDNSNPQAPCSEISCWPHSVIRTHYSSLFTLSPRSQSNRDDVVVSYPIGDIKKRYFWNWGYKMIVWKGIRWNVRKWMAPSVGSCENIIEWILGKKGNYRHQSVQFKN
jgi:hypothetical protein